MVTRRDYIAEKVKAARYVLIELIRLLKDGEGHIKCQLRIIINTPFPPRNSDNLRTDGLTIGRGKIQNTGVRIQEPEEMWSAEWRPVLF
jgi:hypothetical protein